MDIADRANPGFPRGQKRLLRLGRISGCLASVLWVRPSALSLDPWSLFGEDLDDQRLSHPCWPQIPLQDGRKSVSFS